MEKRGIVIAVILIVAGLIIAGFGIKSFLKDEENPIGKLNDSQIEQIEELFSNECNIDSDCVPDSCCHARGCVAKTREPDCSGISCTQECVENTLDCNQGSCVCENKRCKAVINE